MFRRRILPGLIAMICAATGLSQEPQPSTLPSLSDAALRRSIEIEIRNLYHVPAYYTLTFGNPHASQVQDYITLPVTLSAGSNAKTLEFLLSNDGKTLAKLDTFDLAHNPARSIDIAGRPVRGNPQAKVTIISFDDLECPVCARMHQALFPGVLEKYKDQVRVIYKDNPLSQIHPWAIHAAVDANCLAAESGQAYWAYVDYLHTHSEEITGHDDNEQRRASDLDRVAKEKATSFKLDSTKVSACLGKQDETAVRASLGEAAKLGLNYAPAVFVNGERIEGYIPPEALGVVINRALRAEGIEPPQAPAAAKSDEQSPTPPKH